MKIRKATNKDTEQILCLHVSGLIDSGSMSSDTSLDLDLENIETSYEYNGGLFLVAVNLKDEIIGMGALKCINSNVYEIKRMRVHKSYHRQGIAQHVLNALFDFISNKSEVKTLMLDTSIEQKAAQQLYEKNGFIKTGEVMISDIPSFLYKKEL